MQHYHWVNKLVACHASCSLQPQYMIVYLQIITVGIICRRSSFTVLSFLCCLPLVSHVFSYHSLQLKSTTAVSCPVNPIFVYHSQKMRHSELKLAKTCMPIVKYLQNNFLKRQVSISSSDSCRQKKLIKIKLNAKETAYFIV